MKRGLLQLLGLTLLAWNSLVLAYDGALHQELTFIAAKQFNQCVAQQAVADPDLAILPLSPLQVRYMARANVQQAQTNWFTRSLRWNYYNPENQSSRSWMWLIETRMHGHYADVTSALTKADDDAVRFRNLGRILNYVQTVTSPARAVPVYTGRWWRLSMSDRFDDFPLDKAAVATAVADQCAQVRISGDSFVQVLNDTAARTLDSVNSPIDGMPASWTDFWRPAKKAANFGDYGAAGNNFGQATRFRCENKARCVLLDNDPLYRSFAQARHVDAVLGSMRVMQIAAQAELSPTTYVADQTTKPATSSEGSVPAELPRLPIPSSAEGN